MSSISNHADAVRQAEQMIASLVKRRGAIIVAPARPRNEEMAHLFAIMQINRPSKKGPLREKMNTVLRGLKDLPPLPPEPVEDIEAKQLELQWRVDDLVQENPHKEEWLSSLVEAIRLDEPDSTFRIAFEDKLETKVLQKMFLIAKEKEKWSAAAALIKSGKILPAFVGQLFIELCKKRNLDLLTLLFVESSSAIPERILLEQTAKAGNHPELLVLLQSFISLARSPATTEERPDSSPTEN